jgi:peptide/nickel transport system permease protein
VTSAELASRKPRASRRHPLLAFLVRRIAVGVVLVFLVSVLIFAGTEVLPGDAAQAILGRTATPAAVSALRRELHLERPATTRYLDWVDGFVHGNLGTSLSADLPVRDLIGARIRNSLILAGCALLLMIPLSLLFGVLAGTRAGGTADHAISSVSLALIAVPEFVTATILILLFAITTKLLPPVSLVNGNPFDTPSILVLPVAALLLASLAQTIRMVRAGVVEAMRADYIEMARLNGVGERRVVARHVLRNALAPSIQVLALNAQWLIGGVVIVETVFDYPGIGQLLVQAVSVRDIPLVEALSVLIAAVYIGLNILADFLVVLLVPKLRTGQWR